MHSVAANETGWIEGVDASGQSQWFKAIERTANNGLDQTVQIKGEVTLRLQDGTEVFWYARGAASDGNAGDLTQSYAKKTIG